MTTERDRMLDKTARSYFAKFRPIHLAIFTVVFAYIATTGLGAALIATAPGQQALVDFMYPEAVPLSWMTTIGTPLYWSVLLSLVVVVPTIALLTERICRRAAPTVRIPDSPRWIPLGIAGLLSAFCIYKLAMAGGLTAHELWDRSVCFSEKMERRAELFGLLGNRYYSFCYSSLPVLASFLLAKYILYKDRIAGIGFVSLSILLTWFYVAMIMKAPLIIYIGVVAVTLILCGVGFLRTAAIAAPLIAVAYIALSVLQFCNHQKASWDVDLHGNASADKAKTLVYKAVYMTRAVTFRMASSFPYYLQEFSDPKERCGLELPPLPAIPRQTCFPPTKVFGLMYPSVTYVKGYAPAPVNVSAYSELGISYSFIAMILTGILIGMISFFANGRNPLSISLGVVACLFSYYVTQVSLTGSIFDSYGLVWLLLPVGLIVLINSAQEYFRSGGSKDLQTTPS